MDTLVNKIRTYSLLAGVFASQQRDPFCRQCKAMVNSVRNSREGLARLESEHAEELRHVSPEFRKLIADTKEMLDGLVLPENAPGQKKAGNCKLPQGVCLIKTSVAILQQL